MHDPSIRYLVLILVIVFMGACLLWAAKRRLRPRKSMSLDRFCMRAADRIFHKFPQLRLLHVGDSFIEVDAGAGPCTIRLENAYAASKSKPGSANKQIDLAIQAALEASILARPRALAEVQSKILPILKTMDFVDGAPRLLGDRASLHWEPLGNGLAVCYQLGDPTNPVYLSVQQFESWGIAADALRAISVRNLANRTRWKKLRRPKEDGNPALWAAFEVNDGLDASRILLPNLHPRLSKILGGSFVVAVPHRDAMFACVRSHRLVELLQEFFGNERNDPANRLSDRFFLVTDEGITEYAEID